MKAKAVLLAAVFSVGALYVILICGLQSYRPQHLSDVNVKKPLSSGAFLPSFATYVRRCDGVKSKCKDNRTVSVNLSFDPRGRDSLVFIHIPKTGGSNFLSHLVTLERDNEPLCFDSESPTHHGQKKVRSFCPRHSDRGHDSTGSMPWLISEKTLGWHCGLHPFYSEYRSCISIEETKMESARKFDPTCKFHFSTMLRHPILRYISEYLHVQRGATFSYRHTCGKHEVTDQEMPPCYPGFYDHQTWENVTLPKFLSCDSNWANNRQTFSIADLETVRCFDKGALPRSERERMLLESAKENLRRFSFFGLTEYQEESCLLFEHTFGLRFKDRLDQRPVGQLNSAPMLNTLWNTANTYERIAAANRLDMELYDYALQLFITRLRAINIEIDPSKITEDIKLLPTNVANYEKLKYRRLNFNLEER